jgi:hypothetical protein
MRRNIPDIRWKLLPHLYLCLRASVSQFRGAKHRTDFTVESRQSKRRFRIEKYLAVPWYFGANPLHFP